MSSNSKPYVVKRCQHVNIQQPSGIANVGGIKRLTMNKKFGPRGLREKILNDRYNEIAFLAGRRLPFYLVGGYIRDLLIGRDSLDRDYVAGGDIDSLLEKIVANTGGKLVRLGNCLSRIVLKDDSTLDFSPLTVDIEDDLFRRDFTMNSLAWSPDSGLIDPYGGVEHIRQQKIRSVSRDNILHDPVRLIRAYRFAGELTFRIDRPTRRIIRELSGRIKESKSERITLEFFKILNIKAPAATLVMMAKDGILKQLFHCDNKALRSKLRVLSRVTTTLNELPLKYKRLFSLIYSQNLSWEGMLYLEVLMNGLPPSLFLMSSAIRRRLEVLESGRKLLQGRRPSRGKLFEAFSIMGDASVDYLIITGRTIFLRDYELFRTIMKKSLLTTKEIITISGLGEGINLGRAIAYLKRAEFCRKISTRDEAMDLARKNFFHRT